MATSLRRVQTTHAPKAIGPYSQAIGAGELVFCSGQIALDPLTQEMVTGDVAAETQQVLQNVAAVLEASGASFDDVLMATIYLTDLQDFAVVNELYGKAVSADAPPARATVQVSALPKGANVEISVIARAPKQ